MSGHNTGAVLEGKVSRRGTSNGAVRGNSEDRRRRRSWLVETYRADVDLTPRLPGRHLPPEQHPAGVRGLQLRDRRPAGHPAPERVMRSHCAQAVQCPGIAGCACRRELEAELLTQQQARPVVVSR